MLRVVGWFVDNGFGTWLDTVLNCQPAVACRNVRSLVDMEMSAGLIMCSVDDAVAVLVVQTLCLE